MDNLNKRIENMIMPSNPEMPKKAKDKKATTRNNLKKLLTQSSLFIMEKDGTIEHCISTEMDMIHFMLQCETTVKNIIESESETLFTLRKGSAYSAATIAYTALGEKLLTLFKHDRYMSSSIIKLSPYYELFLYGVLQSGIDYSMTMMSIRPIDDPSNSVKERLIIDLNRFVEIIRQYGKSAKFKKILDSFNRGPRKNKNSITDYINSLSTTYSKLLIIRLDFGYRREKGGNAQNASQFSYEKIKAERNTFVKGLPRYLRRKNDAMRQVGYIWKTEYGYQKGWHHHVIIFLDGQRCREDITIAQIIGEYWAQVTSNRGIYYNCNRVKANYKNCGIGMLSHNDHKMRKALDLAAEYLTKPDHYVRNTLPNRDRTFGRGMIPYIKKSTSGRRRVVSQTQEQRRGAD